MRMRMNGVPHEYGAYCGLRELQNPKTSEIIAIIQNKIPSVT